MIKDEQFRCFLDRNDGSDAALAGWMQSPVDAAVVARLLDRLTALPKQKVTLWWLPSALFDWQFTLAWPRLVALMWCAGFGFFVSMAGFDRTLESPISSSLAASHSDLGWDLIEPEPCTFECP